jgi:EAL domain-containing protein (putative c-di-GMP-specific phosphodiesterase class I)
VPPIRHATAKRGSHAAPAQDPTPSALAVGKAARMPTWYLESYAADSGSLWRLPLLDFPVRVGRRPGSGLSLLSPLISQDHAEIFLEGSQLKVRDLGSTNGTFVNGVRLAKNNEAALKQGDVLHFANAEFLIGSLAPGQSGASLRTRTAVHHQLPRQLVARARQLETLLRKRAVVSTLQPIVHLHNGATFGYELLGRGSSQRLPKDPGALFALAETLGVAGELSRLFRTVSIPNLRDLPDRPVLFFNTHPAELEKPGLIESLQTLRRDLPNERMTLEIHEQAATNPEVIHELRRALHELDIQLAYDDFGAGHSRINELIEVPPDYLKFDETLIRDVDRAPATKRKLLRALVHLCRESGIQTLAEGVETEGEAHALRELGFDLAQGYLFGRPKPISKMPARRRSGSGRRASRTRSRR